jgi:photosystem II stability/assembly factor-like uncharacterized protein
MLKALATVVALAAVVVLTTAAPAAAQWARVLDLPEANFVAVSARGDTIVAGASVFVYVSTDGGATWRAPSHPAPAVSPIFAVRVQNGRLYAGTSGTGVFISDDLGTTWRGFNQGLVGGSFDSQLDISDLEVRGDSLYAGTFGAGVYVRKLSGVSTWSHFGEEFEPNQMSNVDDVASGGARLIAGGGANGQVLFRDPGDPDWTLSSLDNLGLHPGLSARSIIWNGFGWVVGTNRFLFISVPGQEPWTQVDVGLGTLNHSSFATRGRTLFASFDVVIANTGNVAVIEMSQDDGASWDVLESFPGFVYRLAMSGNTLFAGRTDGLWRRSTDTVSVPGESHRISFAAPSPNPAVQDVTLRYTLSRDANVRLAVYDAAGRRVRELSAGVEAAGGHVIGWDRRDQGGHAVGSGIYFARLEAEQQVLTRKVTLTGAR